MKSLRSLSVVPGRRLRRKAGKHGASGGSVYDFDGAVCHANASRKGEQWSEFPSSELRLSLRRLHKSLAAHASFLQK